MKKMYQTLETTKIKVTQTTVGGQTFENFYFSNNNLNYTTF